MSQLPPPAYNPYAGESSISASALPPPVYDAHAIPVAQVAPGPIYQQPPYPTQVARFHCLARSESGRRSSLENPASASVNLDCRPLVPTSALACPLPGNLSHLSLSFFFFLRSRKRQTSVAQVHPFSLLSYRALVHPVFSIAVMRDRTSQEPALRGNVSIAPSFSRSLTSRRLLSTRAVIAQSRGASTHSVLRASLPPPLPCFCMRADCTIS